MKRPFHHRMRCFLLVLLATRLVAADTGTGAEFESHLRTWDLPRKKIIEWDWATSFHTLAYLREHVRHIERVPFDGMAITIHHEGRPYQDGLCHEVKWTEAQMQPVFDALAAIAWDAYRHNFIAAFAGEKHLGADSRSAMDWFDDGHWDNILHNIGMMARAAVAGRCAGLLFDPETYHRTVWNYYPNPLRRQAAAPHFPSKSYDDYFQQVRKRGAQYMSAMQAQMPKLVFFNAYLNVRVGPSDTARNIYGLYHAFLNGMLDVAGPDVVFVDGNESSYGYKTKADYDRGYSDIRHRKMALIAPENRHKYAAQVQAGQALYMDEIFGIRRKRRWTGTHLAYADRVRLFEQSLVHAMDAADEYVWIYAEQMNWRNASVPEGALAALTRARARADGLALEKREGDADLDAAVREAIERRDLLNRRTDPGDAGKPLIRPRDAVIHAVASDRPEPTIDGHLDEACWAEAAVLDGFTHLLHYTRATVIAATTARVAWHDEGLLIGFTCADPRMASLRQAPKALRQRNRVRLVIAADAEAAAHVRLDFDMDGLAAMYASKAGEKTWHELLPPRTTPSGAVAVNAEDWTAEWLIPWSCIGGKPRPDGTRRATLLRIRPDPHEYTTWSPMVDANLRDTENLGTWRFAPAR